MNRTTCSQWWGLACALLMGVGSPGASGFTHVVTLQAMSFSPATLTVAPGDTVHFVRSVGTHTVTSGTSCTYDGLRFDQPIDAAHLTFDYVVPSGVAQIPFFCRNHCDMGMTGVLNIDPNGIPFQITLDGSQPVSPNASAATGTGTATLLPSTNTLDWSISFSGLGSSETAAQFRGPAGACATAAQTVMLQLGSPTTGEATLTAQQASDLMKGLWYVDIDTTNFPNGEIRGQVMPTPLTNPIPATIPLGNVRVSLQTVATGLTSPVWGTSAPGHPDHLYVADQTGTVWNIDLTAGTKSVFLNVASRLVTLSTSYDERGLLGLAFHPSYASNGKLYTFTSQPVAGTADFTTLPVGTTPNCQSVVTEWTVSSPSDPLATVNTASARVVLRIDKPQAPHNGGALAFGPDGDLYISLGDGGNEDDQGVGHGCSGNGQDTNSILGKLLRIDVNGSNSSNGKYGLPPSNPFVGGGGLPEIFAYGFRNPFRFSFDSGTGALYAADVGQNDVEEVDLVTSSGNYGWHVKEGGFWFVPNGNQNGYVTSQPLDQPPALIDPIAQYDHDEGSAVIGGFVYRGSHSAQLAGKYVFGDLGPTFNNDGRLFYLDAGNVIHEFRFVGQAALGKYLLGFGEDGAGEIYVLVNGTGRPTGTTGLVLHLSSVPGNVNCDGLVNNGDIDAFVLALTNSVAYQQQYPTCDLLSADVNGDGLVNNGDIDAFVALLTGG